MPETQLEDLMPDQRPPEQHASMTTTSATMPFKATCSPPLDQATVVPRHEHSVKFNVLLQSTPTSPSQDSKPEACIWHNHGGQHEWTELVLTPAPNPEYQHVMHVGQSGDDGHSKHWFTAELTGMSKHAHAVSFTLKFRSSRDQEWQWIKETTGIGDGLLHYQAASDFTKHSSYDINHFFEGLSRDIKTTKEAPETRDTQLYSLTCPVKAAKGKDSGNQHHRLGAAVQCSRWFALVRLWSPWLAPRHGDGSKFELDKDGILLSFLRTDGLHVVCLAISGVQDVTTTFIHEADGNVVIKGRNDREHEGTSRVLVAVAESFEVANCAVMYHARRVITDYGTTESTIAPDTKEIKILTDEVVKPQWLEEWYDGLTYCTWNGLGQDLSAEKVYHALDELSKNNINIANLILDDNWQSLSKGDTQFKRGWSSFEATPTGFPEGLKKTTSEIRKRHPNVNHIAVWHAILGYWGGIDPNGEIAKKYKTIEVGKEAGVAEGTFTVVAPEDAKRMYDDFYAFLSDNGVDSVKTDAQFFLDMLQNAPDRRAMMLPYQDAWTLAHLRHFSSRAISCMSQFPAALFHSQLPHNKPRLLVRNSDDFFPNVEASHPWHIFANAHNSLLTQHLNALPDWDMFQTDHPWARFHAAARCVSGGPIYFTDYPGKHDLPLLHAMTATSPRGKTVILRPSVIGKSTNPYNAYSARAILKIATYHGPARSGASILGLFNVSPTTLSELLPLSAFPGTEHGTYIVSSFNTSALSAPMTRSPKQQEPTTPTTPFMHTTLPPASTDILTAYPLHPLTLATGQKTHVACLGLVHKMTGVAAVTGFRAYIATNEDLRIWVSVKALGVLGLWIGLMGEDGRTVDGNVLVLLSGRPVGRECVQVRKGENSVLEVDIERAFKEAGGEAGWSNEVSLEVFVK